MTGVFSGTVLAWWFSACALVSLSACSRSNANDTETPAATTTGEARHTVAEASPEHAAPTLPRTFGDVHSGEATYYKATGKGNCSFDATGDLMVAAVNTTDYAGAEMCGAHIRVSGPDGTVTVRVVDRCPGCKPGGLDLSRQAFSRIAAQAAGRVPVTWQVIEGPGLGPVAYHYMDGTTRFWTAIQLRNHRWPVAALEIMPEGATEWIPVKRRNYNYFVYSKPISAGPLRVRVTALTGDTLEDELPEPTGRMTVRGNAQFQ